MTDLTAPHGPTGADRPSIEQLVASRLSRWRVVALITLAVVGLVESILLASLVATEPGLPTDTAVAMTGLAVGGAVWTAYAVWQLAFRQVLLLVGRVVATAIGTVFSTVATVGGIAIALARNQPTAAVTIAVGGGILIGVAGWLLGANLIRYRAARRRLAELQRCDPPPA